MTLKHKAWYAVLLIFIALSFWLGEMVGNVRGVMHKDHTLEASSGKMVAAPSELQQFIAQVRMYYLDLPKWFSFYGETKPSFDFGDFYQSHFIDSQLRADLSVVPGFNELVKLKRRDGGFLLFHGGMEVEDTVASFTCSLYMGGFIVGVDTMYVPVRAKYESRCANGLSIVISANATTIQSELYLKWSFLWDVNLVKAQGDMFAEIMVLPCKQFPINSPFYLSFFKEQVPGEKREFTTADYYHQPKGGSIAFDLDLDYRFADKRFNITSWEGPWVEVPVSGVLDNLN